MAYCGSATFPTPCPGYDTGGAYSASPTGFSHYFNGAAPLIQGQVSSGQGVTSHSWASFSAGHWYVLCSAFSVSTATGGMTPSQYIPHEAFNAARDFAGGSYTSPIDSVYPRAGTVTQFYSAASASIPSGYWGSSVALPNSFSFNPELCWRESKTSLSVNNYAIGTSIQGPPIRSLPLSSWFWPILSGTTITASDTSAYHGTSTSYTTTSAWWRRRR